MTAEGERVTRDACREHVPYSGAGMTQYSLFSFSRLVFKSKNICGLCTGH